MENRCAGLEMTIKFSYSLFGAFHIQCDATSRSSLPFHPSTVSYISNLCNVDTFDHNETIFVEIVRFEIVVPWLPTTHTHKHTHTKIVRDGKCSASWTAGSIVGMNSRESIDNLSCGATYRIDETINNLFKPAIDGIEVKIWTLTVLHPHPYSS